MPGVRLGVEERQAIEVALARDDSTFSAVMNDDCDRVRARHVRYYSGYGNVSYTSSWTTNWTSIGRSTGRFVANYIQYTENGVTYAWVKTYP